MARDWSKLFLKKNIFSLIKYKEKKLILQNMKIKRYPFDNEKCALNDPLFHFIKFITCNLVFKKYIFSPHRILKIPFISFIYQK